MWYLSWKQVATNQIKNFKAKKKQNEANLGIVIIINP